MFVRIEKNLCCSQTFTLNDEVIQRAKTIDQFLPMSKAIESTSIDYLNLSQKNGKLVKKNSNIKKKGLENKLKAKLIHKTNTM